MSTTKTRSARRSARYPLAMTLLGIAVGMLLSVINPGMVGWPIALLGVLGLMVDMRLEE